MIGEYTEVLTLLAANDGAMLYWQVPAELTGAFSKAAADYAIMFDRESDCYIHPDAVIVNDHGQVAGWRMP